MLNEVIHLCKGDFAGVAKQYEVYQLNYTASESKLATFDTEVEAKKYILKYFSNSSDIYTTHEIRKVAYDKRWSPRRT